MPVVAGTNCDELLATLSPRVFPVRFTGYELTTPAAQDYVSPDGTYEFGFRPVPD